MTDEVKADFEQAATCRPEDPDTDIRFICDGGWYRVAYMLISDRPLYLEVEIARLEPEHATETFGRVIARLVGPDVLEEIRERLWSPEVVRDGRVAWKTRDGYAASVGVDERGALVLVLGPVSPEQLAQIAH
jgi:hypothetical protein